METATITWSSIHHYGGLWFDHLRLRKSLFVDREGWDVPHDKESEWDQYDSPEATYLVTHQGGRALAALRILSCAVAQPMHSYMIRDAALGLSPNIPPAVMATPSTRAQDYEITRLVVDPHLNRAARARAMAVLSRDAMHHLEERGARRVFALTSPGFIGWFRRMGVAAHQAGPVVVNDLGERFCVLEGRAPFVVDAKAATVPQAA